MKYFSFLAVLAVGVLFASSASAALLYTTGLDVWLDAADIDGSGNSTLNNGDSVATWVNKGTTGVADSLPPGTAGTLASGAGPLGVDAVELSDSRYQFSGDGGINFDEFQDSPNITMYFRVWNASPTANSPLITDYGGLGSELLTIRAAASVSGARDESGDNTWVDDGNIQAAAGWTTLFFELDATAQTATYGELGNLNSTTSAGYDPLTTFEDPRFGPVTLFSFHDGNNGHDFDGFVSEVLIYDHLLSAQDHAAVVDYLDTKVPEPSTIALAGLGLLGLVAARRRK